MTVLSTSNGTPICASCARLYRLATRAPRTRSLLVVGRPCAFHALDALSVDRMRRRSPRAAYSANGAASA